MTSPTPHPKLTLLLASIEENNRFKGGVLFSLVASMLGAAVWGAGAYFLGWPPVPQLVTTFAIGSFFVWLLLKIINYSITQFITHAVFTVSEQLSFYSSFLFPAQPPTEDGPPKGNVFNLFDGPPAA